MTFDESKGWNWSVSSHDEEVPKLSPVFPDLSPENDSAEPLTPPSTSQSSSTSSVTGSVTPDSEPQRFRALSEI